MAESNVIAPVFRGANWGIADDIFTWINNSYFSSKNIEVRENARGISLSKKLVAWTTTTGRINVIVKATSSMYVAFWKSWACYKCVSWTWSSVSTGLSTNGISWAVFNDYIYWCSASKLYKVSVSDMENNASVTPTEVTSLKFSLFSNFVAWLLKNSVALKSGVFSSTATPI